jgi:hypothetical protein
LKKYSLYLVFALLLFIANGCNKKEGGWQTDVLLPIANTELTIANLVGDSLVNVNSDNSLNLVYKNSIFSFDFSNYLLEIPDTGVSKIFRLDSLKLPQQKFSTVFSLGALCRQMIAAGGGSAFLGNTIISRHGGTLNVFALTGLSVPPTNYDASLYFKDLDLIQGWMDGWIKNGFPVAIKNLHFQVRNLTSGVVVVDDYIDSIPARDSVYRLYNLGGKHVEGSFTFEVINFDTPGSYGVPVPIDTNDLFELKFRIFGLKASSATAVFPSIDILTSTEDITQNIPGGAKLTYIEAEEGVLHVVINSSVQEGLNLTYKLEGAYDKIGRPLVVHTFVPPAPVGALSSVNKTYDLKGYSIDLTGKDHNAFNTYTQTIAARIDSSGILRTITSSDSLRISFYIEKIKPKLIKGYAGNDTISVGPSSTAFNFLGAIKSGSIGLNDVKLSLNIENGIGVNGVLNISDFTVKKGASTVSLVAPTVMNHDLSIAKATEFPYSPSNTDILLNKSNSNIKNLFELLPNNLEYAMKVYVNPSGNDGTYQDFVNASSRLNVNLNMEIPLNLVANDLTLIDTMDFALGSTIEQIQSIKSGTLSLIANNGYPLQATLTYIVYDENFNVVDTLVNKYQIQAADLNTSCKVSAEKRSVCKILINEATTELLKQGKKAIIFANLSTINNQSSCDDHLKIYSDYALKLKLTGEFDYFINSKF